MKMKLLFLAIGFLHLFVKNIFGQKTVDGKDLLQVYSPEAYSLARYGDIPVDYSTGVPEINVPLMSISDRDITVSVSLSYHATGILVDQSATWVGLGWALNAGGMITRQVRGTKESYYGNSFCERPIIEEYDNRIPLEEYLSKSHLVHKLDCLTSQRDFYDGEPDIFYYNFCGKAGKFFLDNNANGCFFKYEDFRVEFKNNSLFIITDDLGIVYEFTTSSYDYSQRIASAGNIWHLTKIKSPSGGEITLEYNSRYKEDIWMRAHSTGFFVVDNLWPKAHKIYPSHLHAAILGVENTCEYALLSKITTKSGHYINFNLSPTQRKDAEHFSAKALEEIALYNNNNEMIKKATLSYDYFEANTNRRYRNEKNDEVPKFNFLNYRLRLKSVKEISRFEESEAQYCFEYYGDDNPESYDPYTLPHRLSASQDHWGYYNNIGNITMFANNPEDRKMKPPYWFSWYTGREVGRDWDLICHQVSGGANREPDAEAVKAGTLNKIIYPTGGYTKFDFEPHKHNLFNFYSLGGGLRVKQIESGDGKGNTIVKNYEYEAYEGFYYEYLSEESQYHTLLCNPYDYEERSSIPKILMLMGVPPDIACKDNVYIIKIDGMSRLKLGMGNEPSYTMVTEKTTDNGRTEYHYKCEEDIFNDWNFVLVNGIFDQPFIAAYIRTEKDGQYIPKMHVYISTNAFEFPYAPIVSNQWKGRILTNKKVYQQDGTLIAEDIFTYDVETLHAIPTYKVIKFSDYEYFYVRTYTIGGSVMVNKEIHKEYFPNGYEIYTNKEYLYSSPFHKKVTEIRTSLSQGGHITEKYYYPTEYGDYFQTLVNKNILYPVDVRTYRNEKLISGMQVQYDDNGLPLTRYKSESEGTDIAFNQSNPYTFTPYLWNSYNTANLLTSKTTRDNGTSIYLWGYNGQYPIAEIKNTDQAAVNVALSAVGLTSIDALSVNTNPDKSKLDMLRDQLPVAGTHITTYKYEPLIGITEVTDPSGRTTYFKYDAMSRLDLVKDDKGENVERYYYNYINK